MHKAECDLRSGVAAYCIYAHALCSTFGKAAISGGMKGGRGSFVTFFLLSTKTFYDIGTSIRGWRR